MSFTKINWGGLIEAVYNQPDADTHENEYLRSLKEKVDELEACTNLQEIQNIMLSFTKNDRNYLCSPVLDALVPVLISHASEKNSLQAVIFLAERGVVLEDNNVALNKACSNKNMEMLKYLIEKFVPIYNPIYITPALITCTICNNLEALQFLLEKFPNGRNSDYDLFTAAFYNGHKEIYEFVYSFVSEETKEYLRYREYHVMNKNNIDAVQFLVERGHFRNDNKGFLLSNAAEQSLIMFKYIATLVKDSDYWINSVHEHVNPIYTAMQYHNLELVKYIIEDLQTPINSLFLTWAVRSRSEAIVRYLLSKNATGIERALDEAVSYRNFYSEKELMNIAEILRLELCQKSYLKN